MAVAPLLLHRVLEVQKADLPVRRDGRGDLVDVVVDALVHALDAVADVDLPLQGSRVVHAGQALDLADEREGLALGDELGGLHAVDEQLELGQLEVPRADVIAHGLAARLHDIQPELPQRLEIGVKALALGEDASLGEHLHHLRDADGVRLVGVLREILHQIQQLELLLLGSGHVRRLFSPVFALLCVFPRPL